jgi:threonyl-tRNA synthetase
MRLLCVHADSLAFEAREQARPDEHVEGDGVPRDGQMDDCVAAFVGIEPGDSEDIDGIVSAVRTEIEEVATQLDTTSVVLYPSEHLTDDVAASDRVDAVVAALETAFRDREYDVLRAPDGWYRHLDLSAKGHRFARRSVRIEGSPAEGTPDESSEWILAFPDGRREDPTAATSGCSESMTAFVERETDGGEKVAVDTQHLEPMHEAGFAARQNGPDGERTVYYPRGNFVRAAVREYVERRLIEFGAMPVETASDISGGSVAAMQMMDLSVSALPLGLAEMTAEPTIRTATADGDQAREEMRRQALFACRTSEELGLTANPVIRMPREYYDQAESWVQQVVSDLDRPVLLEVLSDHHSSWTVSVELPTIDSSGRPRACPRLRLQERTAHRHGIEYTDGDETHTPLVLDCSPAGRIEHVVGALVANATRMETPQLPTWLSPTQVRLIPIVPDDHLALCETLADELEASVRVDIDDRAATVGERIESAERDWVPYYAVVGDDERERDSIGVTVRGEGREVEMSSEELRERVLDDSAGFPEQSRYLPRHVSDHPNGGE